MQLKQWQKRIGTWAKAEFPDHTSQSIAAHTLREAIELAEATGMGIVEIMDQVSWQLNQYGNKRHDVGEERADCMILLLTMAEFEGGDIEMELEAKHTVNMVREWGPKDALGVSEHVGIDVEAEIRAARAEGRAQSNGE